MRYHTNKYLALGVSLAFLTLLTSTHQGAEPAGAVSAEVIQRTSGTETKMASVGTRQQDGAARTSAEPLRVGLNRPGAMIGEPWIGAPGITESVAQIMDRERRAPPIPAGEARQAEPPLNLKGLPREQDPSAPAVSQWPPPAPSFIPSAPYAPQTVGTTFLGARFSESNLKPPDSMGAVGPSQVLVVVNGRIKVFDKTGSPGALDASTDTFFASVRSAPTADPHVRYDRLSGRWFITMIDVATVNRVLIAVSTGQRLRTHRISGFFSFVTILLVRFPTTTTVFSPITRHSASIVMLYILAFGFTTRFSVHVTRLARQDS